MLKNIGAEISIRFNGIIITVPAGGLLDVRDFDISKGQLLPQKDVIKSVERQITRKNPGQFEVTEHTDNPQIDAQYRQEIDNLRAENKKLEGELEKTKDAYKKVQEKYSMQAEEINEISGRNDKLKNQVAKLKQDIKELNEEHDAHVKRLTGGK